MVAAANPRIKKLSEVEAVVPPPSSTDQVTDILKSLPIDAGPKAVVPDKWESKMHPGLIFNFKRFSNVVIRDAVKKLEEPKAPMIEIPEKERLEPNPNDPQYREALREYVYAITMISVNATIILGTELASVPPKMHPVEGEEWEVPLNLLGLDVPKDKLNRYLHWVRWYALDDSELAELHAHCRRFNGVVLTSDVEEAQEELKSLPERDSDTGLPVSTES